MKNSLLITILFIWNANAHAQQKPHYTQYILNNYILNPALSGIENYIDLKISARDQWVGFTGAPKTTYISVHGPIGKKDYKTTPVSYSVPGKNPRGDAYWQTYSASEPHHGVGFIMVNDETGLYSRLSANVTYAYHIGLSSKMNLSAGFSGGINKISYNRAKATPNDPNDPSMPIGSEDIYKVKPDIAAGLWAYASKYFFGISAQQVIPQKLAFGSEASALKLVPHLFATAGYRFLLTDDINAIPSVMMKYVSASPTNPQFDLNVKVQFQDLLWLGGSYRLKDGYAGMVGINVRQKFNVGYSYDFTSTEINTTSKGTHELMLGFLINNLYGDTTPRNIW